MSRRVAVDGDTIGTFGDNLAITGYDGTKGTAAVAHTLFGEFNGASHEFFVCHMFS